MSVHDYFIAENGLMVFVKYVQNNSVATSYLVNYILTFNARLVSFINMPIISFKKHTTYSHIWG